MRPADQQDVLRVNINALLKSRKWKRQDLAATKAVSSGTLKNFYRKANPQRIGEPTQERIAQVFGISVEDLNDPLLPQRLAGAKGSVVKDVEKLYRARVKDDNDIDAILESLDDLEEREAVRTKLAEMARLYVEGARRRQGAGGAFPAIGHSAVGS